MPVTIAKEFRWEMGHRLAFHTQGCQNLHGHSYKVILELTGEPDANGMVLDYGDLGVLIKPILAQWDHSMMLDETDEPMVGVLKERGMKLTLVPFPPTAENIALDLLARLAPDIHLPGGTNFAVTVLETSNSSARVETVL